MTTVTGSDSLALAPIERRRALVDLVRSARRRLALTLVRWNDAEVMDEIGAAVDRGVLVDALLSQQARGSRGEPGGLAGLLERMGVRVHVYTDPAVRYHAKILIADDGPALIGSFNLTRRCLSRTCDFCVTTWDPAVVAETWQLFEHDCGGGLPGAVVPDGRLLVAPGSLRGALTTLIERASRSIWIVDHKLRDPSMLSLLDARRAEGVAIDLLGASRVLPYRAHGRLLLIDESTAVIGSASLSRSSLDERREIAIVVSDPALVARLCAFVRWAADRDRDESTWHMAEATPCGSSPA